MRLDQIILSRSSFLKAAVFWAAMNSTGRAEDRPLDRATWELDSGKRMPVQLGAYPAAATLGGRPVEIVSVFCGASEPWPSSSATSDLLVSWHLDPSSGGGTYAWWANGKGDRIATAAAKRARSLTARHVYVRPWAEFNADWVDFGAASDFVAAWRRVRDLFKQHAPGVKFLFNPTTDTYAGCWDVRQVWPGTAHVDLHGLDGYNWARTEYGGWRTFDDIYWTQYTRLQACASLPVWVCEFGCAERPAMGDKGQWYRDMGKAILARYPRIEALVTFNVSKEEDWRVDSSTAALDGFTAAIAML